MSLSHCVCVCVCVWGVGWSERSEWSQWLLCLLPGRKASRCCAKLLLLLLLLLLLAACCVRRAAFCRKRLLVSCQLVPSSGFVGCAHPIGNTGRGMRRAARARCCVGAGEGVAAAARWTLRQICAVLLRLCVAAIPAPFLAAVGKVVGLRAHLAPPLRRFSAATQAQDAELSVSAAAVGAVAVAVAATTAATTAAACCCCCVCVCAL